MVQYERYLPSNKPHVCLWSETAGLSSSFITLAPNLYLKDSLSSLGESTCSCLNPPRPPPPPPAPPLPSLNCPPPYLPEPTPTASRLLCCCSRRDERSGGFCFRCQSPGRQATKVMGVWMLLYRVTVSWFCFVFCVGYVRVVFLSCGCTCVCVCRLVCSWTGREGFLATTRVCALLRQH